MPTINENYLKLKAGYLFPEIARRVREYSSKHPHAKVIRMGIGDVTEPLPQACIEAMHKAVDDMSRRETFRGYPPEQGPDWLRHAIAENDFRARSCEIADDEIFVSDGSKCDCANILDIFGANTIAVSDPVYPVYVDTNVMAGHTGGALASGEYDGLIYLPATAKNGFVPDLPTKRPDIIYLCSPNNPTGAAMSREVLKKWVDYANENRAVIFFDAAYEAYISDASLPHSIFEIEGARNCAIEFRSFSKLAGFTGVRAGYTVVPKTLTGQTRKNESVELHKLWLRRHTTKFNGVSYITARACEAVYSPQGRAQVRSLINHYMTNAATIREEMGRFGYQVFGGVHAPYLWVQTPAGTTSWEFFDRLLNECQVVCTPGAGFGRSGEGYVRISAFNSRENVDEAMRRISSLKV